MANLIKSFPHVPSASGFDENLDVQGELILQDTFQVWDPKSLIRKGRDRHLFLFEISLVFSKEIKDSAGRSKYIYKNKLQVPEMIWLCAVYGLNINIINAVYIERSNHV